MLTEIFTVLHIIAGAFFAMNMIIMQNVTTRIMQMIPPGSLKKDVDNFLEKGWRRVMTVFIILMIITALYMIHANLTMILTHKLYILKAITGSIAIIAVASNHFYFRFAKKKKAKNASEEKRIDTLKKISGILEKTAMYFAVFTALLAIFIKHGGIYL